MIDFYGILVDGRLVSLERNRQSHTGTLMQFKQAARTLGATIETMDFQVDQLPGDYNYRLVGDAYSRRVVNLDDLG